MNRLVLVLAMALLPLAAAAQKASKQQVDTISSVGECLAVGLPRQWKELNVVVELPEALAESGAVRYQVIMLDDSPRPFEPCDPHLPAVKLLALRDLQPDLEKGWTMLILTMKPDASFNLRYKYPQQQ